MNIGIVQLNTTIGDVEGNMKKALDAVQKLSGEGVDLIVFPELFITGYPPRDLIYRKDLIDANMTASNQIINWSKDFNTPITFGWIEPNAQDGQKAFFNAITTAKDGQVINHRRKTLLPTYDVFAEDRYFQAGDVEKEFRTFLINGVKVGVIDCEEAWNDPAFWKHRLYSFDPVSKMVEDGAKYIVICNASPYRQGIVQQRHQMMSAHCRRHSIECVYVNQVGYNDDIGFDGNSFAMNARGEVVFAAATFREEVSSFDTSAMRIPDSVLDIPWQQEVILAMQTGVRDYFTKLGINGPAIIGLSGGIDSALVAFIAATALGKNRVIGVGMPSEFSSEHSKNDAAQLAIKLDIHFVIEDIFDPHEKIRRAVNGINDKLFTNIISKVGPSGFTGKLFDRERVKVEDSGVTDENIQARVRGIYLMALANYYNGMVLSTGNKSELAVGYCTIYGDMCGGLAVISDLMKTKVFEVCRWINETMRNEIIPWNTINKPPSAELRAGQTDQQSLPPYETLDEILAQFVEESKTPDAIANGMSYDRAMKYKSSTGRELVKDVYWVCQTVVRNEFKRKQAPTGLKLTKKMFKNGWEHPIVHKLPVHGVVKQDEGASPAFPLGGEKV